MLDIDEKVGDEVDNLGHGELRDLFDVGLARVDVDKLTWFSPYHGYKCVPIYFCLVPPLFETVCTSSNLPPSCEPPLFVVGTTAT